jgi:hypothetical protein
MKCPKCNYERKADDDAPSWQCPSCKVAYAKAAQAQLVTNNITAQRSPSPVATSKVTGDIEASDDSERQALAASGQKIVIYCILANFVLRAIDQTHSLSIFVMQALYAATAIISLIGIVRICSGLQKGQGAKITFMMLSFWPLLNLITLIYLSAKTNRLLKDAGWRTGLFGARP